MRPIAYLAKSLLISAADLSLLCATENKKASSVNNLVLDDNSSAKSFMYIKKNSGPSIEPCGTPVLTLVYVKTCPVKSTVFCSLKSHITSLKACQICHFVLI